MNYNDYSINFVSSYENNDSVEACVYISHKNDKNNKFVLFSQVYNKNDGSVYFKPNRIWIDISRHSLNGLKLSDDEIEKLINHFKDIFINNYISVEKFIIDKNISLDFYSKVNFDQLVSVMKDSSEPNTREYIFFNTESNEILYFYYNYLDKKLDKVIIAWNFSKIPFIYIFDESSINESNLKELFEKVKNCNKYRLKFLFEGK